MMLHGPFQEVSQIWVVQNYVSSKFSHEEIAILGESPFFFVARHATSDSDKTQRGEVEERVSRSLFHLHCEVIPQVNLA